ncbi:LysR family transcriptional regulator [Bradyrhizobium sp.]|jgi:DNA-binding transcriptional LysR family regulator|uniref:LysR family transcriptional regulator n=1 Tax=Bradyrhizobium sp. TaxID=376 RepID=UPI003D135676
MDRLEAMSILLAAAETGSLSAAGRRLGKPLTTISRKVVELETHLNVRLLNRSGRRLSLTDAGRSYAQASKRILEDVREAERSASGEYSEPKGDLVITTSLILGRQHVLPIVAEFLKANPGINVELLLANRVVNMMEEQVDLAIRIGNSPDSSLIAIHLGSTRRVVCGSPAYFSTHGIPRTPADLAKHDCVTIGGFMSPGTWTFRSGKSEIKVPVRSRLVVSTAEAALDAAIAGVGIVSALSFQLPAAIAAGQLKIVLRDFEPEPMSVDMLYVGGRLMPRKLRAFCDFAAPRLRATLSRPIDIRQKNHPK